MLFHQVGIRSLRIAKTLLMLLGGLFLMLLILAFTSLPFWMLYDLATVDDTVTRSPAHLILMGGSGMPGEDNLIRIYYCAEAAHRYPQADVYILLPGDTSDSQSDVSKIKQDLLQRGVEPYRIHFAIEGVNTRSQALEMRHRIDTASVIMIISSPEHIYRSVKTFEKVGFSNIRNLSAFGRPNDVSLSFKENYGGNELVPDIGNYTGLRYQFWVHLRYEVRVFREYAAIVYYKLKGWI